MSYRRKQIINGIYKVEILSVRFLFTASGASQQHQNPSFWQLIASQLKPCLLLPPPPAQRMLIGSFMFRQADNQRGGCFSEEICRIWDQPTEFHGWCSPLWRGRLRFSRHHVDMPLPHKAVWGMNIQKSDSAWLPDYRAIPGAAAHVHDRPVGCVHGSILRGAAVKLEVICKWLLYKVKYHSQEGKVTLVDF